MNKKQKLEYLQELSIDFFIESLEKGTIHARDMASVISMLNQNSIVEEKTQSSLEEEIKKRVKEAEKRRNENTK